MSIRFRNRKGFLLFMFCSLYWDIYAVQFNHEFNDRTEKSRYDVPKSNERAVHP